MDVTEVLDPAEEQERLRSILEPRYLAVLLLTQRLVQQAFARHLSPGLPSLTAETVRRVRALVAARVSLIDGTTRKYLQEAIDRAGWEGVSARETVEHLYQTMWATRANLVASHELFHAANEIALDRYAATGVIDRLRLDESQATDYCKNRHNQVVPIESRPGLAHPACRLKIQPIMKGEVA